MAEVMTHRSSYIASTTYDRYDNSLEVEFSDGVRYRYEGVPLGIYHQLVTSSSIGSAFRRLIYDSYDGEEV